MEPGVSLPEPEFVPLMNRDMPSEGMDGSGALKTGEPVEVLGVIVAEMLDIFASGLCLLRSSRRCDTSSPSRACEYLDGFWLLCSSGWSMRARALVGGDWGGDRGRLEGDCTCGSSGEGGSSS